MLPSKEVVISAIKKDIYRRYISVVALQSDGRLELDRACINVLAPSLGEEFSIIDDKSSVIIARKPISVHSDRVISTINYGSGIDGKTKWRLRLTQTSLRILLACKVGFRAFRYGDEVALEAEPFIPPVDSHIYNSSTIEELGPYVLRSSRSILHIHCVNLHHHIFPSELGFKLTGEYWNNKYHQDIYDISMKSYKCSGEGCAYCKSDVPIFKNIYWFPAVGYNFKQHYARPTLLSFNMPDTKGACDILVDECDDWARVAKRKKISESYIHGGNVTYTKKNLFKIQYSNDKGLNLSRLNCKNALTKEEKGLMKLSFKELETYIFNFDVNYNRSDN